MKTALLCLAVLPVLVLAACPSDTTPCDGVTCSGHGFCAITPHHTPQCLCDEGYKNQGPTECVPDEGADCTTDADCDDHNPCTDDACDPVDGCQYTDKTDLDADSDGYYDAACPGGDDCNDGDAAVNPGATENQSDAASCTDGIDNDCDGLTDDDDPACQGSGAVYYVRTDGDDNNNGTENTAQGAWLTIQKAADTLVAGETVLVQTGTYHETVTPQNSGQDGQPITYRADGWVILDGETSLDYAFNLSQKTYIVIDGFEMTLYRDSGGDDGTVYLNNTSHSMIRNCYIHDTGRDCISMYTGSNDNLVENCLLVSCYDDGISPGGDNITVRSCTIHGTAEWGVENQAGTNVLFENNIIWDAISSTNGYTFRYNDHRDSVLSGDGNISQDPLFINVSSRDFHLSHTAAGQGSDSPCIDAGSDTASNLGLDARTTRTDGVPDTGTVDMGYHYLP